MGGVRDEIAKNLLYYRKKKGITQKKLAEFLSVNNSAVSNWEKGLNSIDIDTLHKACLALNISVSDMFGAFSNMSSANFTPDELDFITKFRKLDTRGKTSVINTLNQEYSYIEEKCPHIPDMELIAKEARMKKQSMDGVVPSKK